MSTTARDTANDIEPDVSDGQNRTDLTPDETFHILRNQRRRYALYFLLTRTRGVMIGDLAEQIAAWENDTMVDEVTSRQRKLVYNSLQQTHLPKLAEKDVVEYDDRTGTVELASDVDDFDVYLEFVEKRDVPWNVYYFGLGAIGIASALVTWLNVGPFGALPNIAAAVFVSITLIVSAIANYFYRRQTVVGEKEKPPELRGDN